MIQNIIGLIVSLLFISALGFRFNLFKIKKNPKICKGIIIRENETKGYYEGEFWRVYSGEIEYIVNDKKYYITTPGGSTAYRKGKKVRVMYNQEKPDEAHMIPSLGMYFSFIFMYLIFIIYFVFLILI